MEYPAAVLEVRKSDALVHIRIQPTSIYSPYILLQFLASLLLLAQLLMQIPWFWGAQGRGSAGTAPGARLGEHRALPGISGTGEAAGSPGTPGQAGILCQEPGIWDPFIQPSMIWFYLSCEGCGIESTWKQLDSH